MTRRLAWPGVLAWALWVVAVPVGIAAVAWLDHLLRRAGRPDLAPLGESGVVYVVGAVSAATVGVVLAGRRPRHPVGWLLLALGVLVAEAGVTAGYARYGVLVRPGALPAADFAAVANSSPADLAACIGFILLLTPTGSLPSPRWRWWARAVVVALVVSLVLSALGPLDEPYQSVDNPLVSFDVTGAALAVGGVIVGLAFAVTGLSIPIGAASLVVRFRRARGLERQQLRWLAFAAALAGVLMLAVATLVLLTIVARVPARFEAALGWLSAACVALLPLATGAAVLRYRLYDLDRIISRTLAYGLLTVLLGGAYTGVVLGLGQLLGQDKNLVVAGATLALAAAFQPARRRVQDLVDRRFNRRRYDAAQTIEAFSDRLRQHIDLDTLTAELLGVVDQTMQPTQVSVWLRPQAR